MNDFDIYASDLAKYVLAYAYRNGIGKNKYMTNLKLQKIMYYIEGYYLAKYDHSLYPALIEGWMFGPTLPSIYYEYAQNGAEPIRLSEEKVDEAYDIFESSIDDPNKRELINKVISDKMNLDLWDLVHATMDEEPYQAVKRSTTENHPQPIITKRSIKRYFKRIAKGE